MVLQGYHNSQLLSCWVHNTSIQHNWLEIDVNYIVVLDVVKVYFLQLIVHGHDEIRIDHALVTQLECMSSHAHHSLQ